MPRLPTHAVQGELKPLANVRNIIAVGSGKGGVGKSTTAVNLALALAAEGLAVGVLDADVYGPSVPMMLGLSGRPDSPDGKTIEPMRAHGIEAMSIGLLVDQDTPMIWRGPMATSALTQLLTGTRWGDLDVLVVDLPPGTGDISLSLAQFLPRAELYVVTTPQPAAQKVAQRAAFMAEKVRLDVKGVTEAGTVISIKAIAQDGTLYGIKAISKDGRVYEGAFKQAKPDGKGLMTYPDGYRYEGDWVAGQLERAGARAVRELLCVGRRRLGEQRPEFVVA